MKGYVFITSSGYDPERGRQIKDPYLGSNPSFGGCMPNIRRQVDEGDHIFVISGRIPEVPQFVVGGLEVADKISALEAHRRYPEMRLRETDDGEVAGNILVNSRGEQHRLDNHRRATFARRIHNYVVGRNPIALVRPEEIARGRAETAPFLRALFHREGQSPIRIVGRWRRMDEDQVRQMRQWLASLKAA